MPADPPEQSPPEKKTPKTKRSQSAVPRGLVGRAGRLAKASVKSSMRMALAGPRSLIGRDSEFLKEELHAATAQELVATLGRLKGASMKVGQLASFIDAGVMPVENRDAFQEVMASLRDAAPPMKPKLVGQVFEREFDATPGDLFASFDESPAAAASLGQVHFATLEDGTEVAVKIQYPGIEDAIRSDLAMTAAVKPMMPMLAPGMDVDAALKEIKRRVLEECDYLGEAETLSVLADHYEGHPFISIPRPIMERTSPRVLTMQRAYGSSFDDIKKLPQEEKDRVGEMLFRFYYGSMHRLGFTSADPHPGNYKLTEAGSMALFDFGLRLELPPEMREHMHQALNALISGDVDEFYQRGIAMGYIRRPEDIQPQMFYEWVHFSLAPIREDRQYTFTRDFIAERTGALMDPRNPWWDFLRNMNLPPWAILQYRLELGLFAVLAQLGATGNWHRMTMEFYGEMEPSTELGAAEADWGARGS